MTRLDKKCIIASTGTHVLLMLMLLLSPAFAPKNETISLPVIHFIPSKIIDGAVGGGGSPPPTPQKESEEKPAQPPVQPQKPAPKVEPKPQQQPKPVTPTPKPADPPAKQQPSKPRWQEIKPSLQKSSTPPPRDSAADRAAAEEAAKKDYLARLDSTVNALSRGFSSSTRIDIPGPGGAAYADYAQVVELIYRRAWSPPRDLSDSTATVTVSVVIRRNGDVESFTITRRSRHGTLDKSVERLSNIKFIAPFP
jgi:outer membrane biosynthesis protein TonB